MKGDKYHIQQYIHIQDRWPIYLSQVDGSRQSRDLFCRLCPAGRQHAYRCAGKRKKTVPRRPRLPVCYQPEQSLPAAIRRGALQRRGILSFFSTVNSRKKNPALRKKPGSAQKFRDRGVVGVRRVGREERERRLITKKSTAGDCTKKRVKLPSLLVSSSPTTTNNSTTHRKVLLVLRHTPIQHSKPVLRALFF